MKNILTVLLLFLLRPCELYSQDMVLIYSGMTFNIPDGYSVIGSTNLGNNMLAFRYGEERGKRFVAFSDITNDTAIDYGCPIGEFYIELFSPTGNTSCHKKELDLLTDEFLKGGIKKVWETSDAVINYLNRENELRSFVFICKKDGETFQVDSDFLIEDDYRKMFGNFLPESVTSSARK